MSIPRARFSMPEVFGNSVEREEGVIRRFSPLLGVVTDPSHLLLAIEDEDGRLQIEDNLGGRFGLENH